MNVERFSNVLGIVMFSVMILSSISVLMGQLIPGIMDKGFFAYLLNIFASPITMFFHLFVGWFADLSAIWWVIAFFFAIGVVGLAFVLRDIKTGTTLFGIRITRFVFEIFMFLFGVMLIVALAVLGFGILNDSSVWSGSWLIILILITFVSLIARTCLLIQETRSKTTFISSHEK